MGPCMCGQVIRWDLVCVARSLDGTLYVWPGHWMGPCMCGQVIGWDLVCVARSLDGTLYVWPGH